MGGAGRAKGFGGPWAPAERRAPADGEGGGRTTRPVCCWPFGLLGLEILVSSGASSAVPPSSPDCSLGIWTLSLGLFASDWLVLLRVGARTCGTAGTLSVRCMGCGDLCMAGPGDGRGDIPLGRNEFASF